MFCLNMMFLFQNELMLFQLLINTANVHHSTKLKSVGGGSFSGLQREKWFYWEATDVNQELILTVNQLMETELNLWLKVVNIFIFYKPQKHFPVLL
jgi:hypothetical protein